MTILSRTQTQERNNYILEIVDDVRLARTIKKSRIKGGYSRARKIVAVFVMAFIIGVSALSGFMATSTNVSSGANADFSIFNANSWGCVLQDDPKAYLGGTNSIIDSAWKKTVGNGPAGDLLNVAPTPDGKAGTALEKYGYFAPTYTTWQGMNVNGTSNTTVQFIGTGGTGDGYGSVVNIDNPTRSNFFSQSAGDCWNVGGSVNVGVANAIASLPKFMVAVSGEAYDYSSTITLTDKASPLYSIGQGVQTIILGSNGKPGLKDILFLDFLTPIVIVAAIGLIWTGLIKRSSLQAAQGALWMVGAAIAGILFLLAPLKIASVVDDIAMKINASVSSAVINNDSSTNLCSIPGDDTKNNQAVRQIKCSIWYSSIYVPWVSGQFGVDQNVVAGTEANPTAKQLAQQKMMTTDPNTAQGKSEAAPNGTTPDGKADKDTVHVSPSATKAGNTRGVFANFNPTFGTQKAPSSVKNWAFYQMDRQSNYPKNNGLDYSEVAYNQLVINDNGVWKNADGAIGASFLTLLGAIGPSIVLLTLSFALIGYQLTMLILITFSPIFFLAGVAPGWGRRIAMRWLELIVGLLVKRIILSIFLLVFIKLYTLVLSAGIAWYLQIILAAVLSFVALTQRDKIMNIFSDAINFGGHKGIGGAGQVQSIKQGARTAAVTANNATRVGVRTATRVATKGGGVVASGRRAAAGRVQDTRQLKKQGDLKLGVGSNRDIKAHDNVKKIENLDLSRLRQDELKHVVGADGKLDQKKGTKWLNNTKKHQAAESQSINNDYKRNVEETKAIRGKKTLNMVDKKRQLEAKRVEREEIRVRQAKLNKEVKRVFGVAGKSGGAQYRSGYDTKSNQPLATEYKPKFDPKSPSYNSNRKRSGGRP